MATLRWDCSINFEKCLLLLTDLLDTARLDFDSDVYLDETTTPFKTYLVKAENSEVEVDLVRCVLYMVDPYCQTKQPGIGHFFSHYIQNRKTTKGLLNPRRMHEMRIDVLPKPSELTDVCTGIRGKIAQKGHKLVNILIDDERLNEKNTSRDAAGNLTYDFGDESPTSPIQDYMLYFVGYATFNEPRSTERFFCNTIKGVGAAVDLCSYARIKNMVCFLELPKIQELNERMPLSPPSRNIIEKNLGPSDWTKAWALLHRLDNSIYFEFIGNRIAYAHEEDPRICLGPRVGETLKFLSQRVKRTTKCPTGIRTFYQRAIKGNGFNPDHFGSGVLDLLESTTQLQYRKKQKGKYHKYVQCVVCNHRFTSKGNTLGGSDMD